MAQSQKQVTGVTLLGNILEFYDLGLFGFFAPIIAPLFFPTDNSLALLIASMGVFAAGFLSRPLGAIVFGYIGDHLGRKISLTNTILLMALPTFVIGILPTYEQIGLLAPAILTLCRLMQGVCTGGEYNNAAIYMLEHQDLKKRGLFSGLMTASSILGFFLASSASVLINVFSLPMVWGWRLPFLFGALIGVIGFYLRRSKIAESPVFEEIKQQQHTQKTLELVKASSKGIISTIGIGWLAGTLSLTLVGYMVSYLVSVVGITTYYASVISNLGLLIYMIGLPFMGALSDKIGHNRVMQLSSILTILLSYPAFCFLTSQNMPLLYLGEGIIAILASMFLGPMHAYMLDIFPVQFRCRGISTSFALGVGLLGGTAPLISTLFIKNLAFNEAPSLYFIISGIAGLIATSLKPNNIRVFLQSDQRSHGHQA